MEPDHNDGKTATEDSQKFLESKRELRLIGEQVDRLFLSRHSSPLLPEWNPAESELLFSPDEVEEGEEKFEQESDATKGNSVLPPRSVPVESLGQDPRDESVQQDENLATLIEKVRKLRQAWSLI